VRARVPAILVVFGLTACGRTGLRVDERATASSSSGSAGGSGGDGGSGGAPPTGVVQLALGAQHSCVRTLTGEVYCWGGNDHGQIGAAVGDMALAPIEVKLPKPAVSVAAGTYTTCAILSDGRLFCWGENGDAEMGNGVGPDAASPVEVPLPTANPVAKVALGEAHVCAITSASTTSASGALWCWGRNASAQVGIGPTSEPVGAPVFVKDDVSDVALGAFHSNAIGGFASTPVVLGWGTNDAHQAGIDGPTVVGVPEVALPATSASRVRSGHGAHSCGGEPGQATFCWGSNTSGQLGRGIVTESELPDLVVTAIGFDELALGYAHTCGLSSGAVFCWGLNTAGQLGNGTTALSAIVSPVPNLSGVQAIAAGTLHTCAYLSKTDIRCWGANDFGQLGDGTTVGKLTPVSIQLP